MFENPFNQPYLTEGIRSPSELIAQYSFLPFQYVREQVDSSGNVLLLGRKGIGKTMILRLFDGELVEEAYRDTYEKEDVRKHVPTAAVGVYVNLASPLLRIREFSGRGQPVDWWQRAFSDYLNYVALKKTLESLVRLTRVPAWRKASVWNGPAYAEAHELVGAFLEALKNESKIFEACANLEQLNHLIDARLKGWVRFLNRDSTDPPETPLALGVPLFALAGSVRAVCAKFRILLLVDQYETLHSFRELGDLRPAFNQSMYEASRGSTGVEFKIGSRPYAHGDLQLLSGSGTIESGREVNFVQLDQLAGKYFLEFAAELLGKRLRLAGFPFGTEKSALDVAREFIPALSPFQEAERYVNRARIDGWRPIAAYCSTWTDFGVRAETPAKFVADVFGSDTHPLVAVETAIALTHWLARGRRRPPRWTEGEQAPPDVEAQLLAYGAALKRALERRYEIGTTESRRNPTTRAADDLISSWEQAALFRLSSAYKNQSKYYTGFDTIARVSSNVALVFIQIMKTAWDLEALRGGNVSVIPPAVQSEAVYAVSESWFSKISHEYEDGVRQERFMRALGAALRKIQMHPLATIAAPNGFSISSSALTEKGANSEAVDLLRMLVSWGLLEEEEHQDKTVGKPKRRKYSVNRVFCPYFGISDLHLRDPFYVRDVTSFVKKLLADELPEEIQRVMSARPRSKSSQPSLF